jgi:hypothetical protein
MTGPRFLCIGAQKAGTTWLHRALERRPDVWLPPVKELHFFDEKINESRSWFELRNAGDAPGVRWRRQIATERRLRTDTPGLATDERRRWCGTYFFDRPSPEWYGSLFPEPGVSGEITPDYGILQTDQISRVVAMVPDIKVIYLLRNPIDREWSAAQMAMRSGRRGADSVLRGRHLQSRYHENVTRWRRALHPGHLYVGFYEDLDERPAELLSDILEFLGATSADVMVPEGRPNAGNIRTIPREYARVLAKRLHDPIETLVPVVGGPSADWLQVAKSLRAIEDGPDLAYPLAPPDEPVARTMLSSVRI